MTEQGGRTTLITATAPTPNGPLHLGHLSGPYIAADIAARAARRRGQRVVAFSGVDPNQNYVVTKAIAEGRSVQEVLDTYQTDMRVAFERARVEYDVFVQPDVDTDYRDAVAGLIGHLVASGAATIAETTVMVCGDCDRTMHHAYVGGNCPTCGLGSGGGTCEGCGGFNTGATMRDARCSQCGSAPAPRTVAIPVLDMEKYRDQLAEVWARAVLPPRVRDLIGSHLAWGLPTVPLAYPTDWGIELAGTVPSSIAGQRVDVWVEMGLGMLYATARHIDPTAAGVDDYLAAWRNVDGGWHFLGIDNAFYFAVLFPALFAALGVTGGKLGGMVVNEFYRLDGLKFSTSRKHAIWANEFLAVSDPALLRLYLSWDRPDSYESDFTEDGYRAFVALLEQYRAGKALAELEPVLSAQNLDRAERALELPYFSPALALRCLLGHEPGNVRAADLLRLLTAEPR
ncbi:MAG TPA: class I tRNA ligase family protein [Pseudonocardiaceae bacterium]|nr:class I tRNA ligase family protein [Pseudonocardiaceae bacterium]